VKPRREVGAEHFEVKVWCRKALSYIVINVGETKEER